MTIESLASANLSGSFTPTPDQEWGEGDVETLVEQLSAHVHAISDPYAEYNREEILESIGGSITALHGLCICLKSHFTEALMIEKTKLECS